MTIHRRTLTPALTGPLIAFVDFFALLGQTQFLLATYERMRQPMLAELSVLAEQTGASAATDIALVTVSVDAAGLIYIDDDPDTVALGDLAARLAPLRATPGTAYLHGDASADWGLMLSLQRTMAGSLDRDIVAPILK